MPPMPAIRGKNDWRAVLARAYRKKRALQKTATGPMKTNHFPARYGAFPDRLLAAISRLTLLLAVALQASPANADDTDPLKEIVALRSTADLPEIKERKFLRALVTYGRTDFTILPNGKPQGVQVELLSKFESMINKGVKNEVDRTGIVYIPTTSARILDDLNAGRGDIAATLLTATPERLKRVDFVTDGVMKVDEIAVTHKSVRNIDNLEDLAGREVHILQQSHYAEHLEAINHDLVAKGLSPMMVTEVDSHLSIEDLLEMLNAGVIKITVADDFKVRLWARVLRDIRLHEGVVIKSGTQIGWALRKNNPALREQLEAFRKIVKKGTLLGNILFKRYFQNPDWIKSPIAESERSKFRRVIDIFDKYAERYDFDVLAAVAQAYQESGLDHSKKSRSGAVGIMQLLPATASDPNVDIPDIHILENNIHAGVKYLAFLRNRYFSDPGMSLQDRLAFSWAAYNAGPARVIQMRRRAEKLGLNPDAWFDNVEVAAARIVGNETVSYVRNIFKYYTAYTLIKETLEQKNGDEVLH